MDTNIRRIARQAKLDGYTHMASVVKSVYDTTYYHVVSLDSIIEYGIWPAAYIGKYPTADNAGTWHGRLGTRDLPDHTILRKAAYTLYR